MPNKLQAYAEQAERTARQITGSHLAWTAFLTTAARLYKYPYNEQLMIYMQRPEATACAEYDFWNEKMGRYVRRGSAGIALIDATGYKPRLKYVFDVADTGGGVFRHLLVGGDDPDEHGGRRGDRHLQGRDEHRGADGRDDAHGRLGDVRDPPRKTPKDLPARLGRCLQGRGRRLAGASQGR